MVHSWSDRYAQRPRCTLCGFYGTVPKGPVGRTGGLISKGLEGLYSVGGTDRSGRYLVRDTRRRLKKQFYQPFRGDSGAAVLG